mmetsp:Transcript_18210/g.28259  ORF Transcript_18210/g.28259 Transcript_18210/m.28259 type:complete len:105 (-) Transcript_18210:220-534(-)
MSSGIAACMQKQCGPQNYYSSLFQWQRDFNAEVLEPRGMLCKTKAYAFMIHTGDGKQQRVVVKWISIAFSPDEVAALKVEPHVSGAVGCCCCDCNDEKSQPDMF